MKLVILAGGKGTRISEQSFLKPKPLIEIGNRPIIWHIMKIYSYYGIKEFIICCGYKGYLLKEYFSNYFLHNSDVTINVKNNKIDIKKKNNEDWKISLIDTGEETLTGGRILRIKDFIDDDFLLTYGDGLANINIKQLINFHKTSKKLATMTVVKPHVRFGIAHVDKNNLVTKFSEKPKNNDTLINGGFFVLKKDIFKYLNDDSTIWEKEPLEHLAKDRQLAAFLHEDFWYAMDTLREKMYLDNLWNTDCAPWKIWNG
jgi:glucose-1-phosphate cytidylyltransferase